MMNPCPAKGFKPGFSCLLPEDHDGIHRFNFVADPKPSKPPSPKPYVWSIEEAEHEGTFDVFRDRRAAAYDLDLEGAVGFVKRHRDFKKGDRISVTDRRGQPVQVG